MPTKKLVMQTQPKPRKQTEKKQENPPSHEQIAMLAERYWAERGRPLGSPEQDWLRAERELMGKAS
jgi:DNA replication protein DnaD